MRAAFARRPKLEFHAAVVTPEAGLLGLRELDDVFGLTGLAAESLTDPRTGRTGQHGLLARWIMPRPRAGRGASRPAR